MVVCALGWVAGLWFATLWTAVPWPGWLLFGAGSGAALVTMRQKPAWRWPLAALVCLGLGAARYQASLPLFDATFIGTYTGQGVAAVEGIVSAEPDRRDTYVNLQIEAKTLFQPGQAAPRPIQGRVLVTAPRYSEERRQATGEAEFQYGDRLTATGLLVTPVETEAFSYKDYLARQGVYAQLRNTQISFSAPHQGAWFWEQLYALKDRARRVLAQTFPEPHAALLTGILLGDDAGLPATLKEAFSATDTAHIIAISGFNVALLAGILAALTRRLLGVKYAVWGAILGLAAYTLLVGANASVVRAAIMGSLALIARHIGRRSAGLNGLALAVWG